MNRHAIPLTLGLTLALAVPLAGQDTTAVRLPVPELPIVVAPPPLKPLPDSRNVDAGKGGHISITRDSSRVRVRLPLAAASPFTAARPQLSEPFRLRDRTRLYLIVNGAKLPAPLSIDAIAATGLLEVQARELASGVQLTVSAPGIGEYGLEPDNSGITLWLVPASATPATARPPLPAQAAIPRPQQPAPPAQAAPEPFGREATVANGPAGSTAGASEPTGSAGAVRIALTNVSAALRVRIAALQLSPLVVLTSALATLILVLFVWLALRLVRRRPPQPEPENGVRATARALAPAASQTADPRLWAARTLAGEGLDAGAIARRTGLARDAATLLVLDARRNVPPAAGSSRRNTVGRAGPERGSESSIH
jgi:hypothetical protein